MITSQSNSMEVVLFLKADCVFIVAERNLVGFIIKLGNIINTCILLWTGEMVTNRAMASCSNSSLMEYHRAAHNQMAQCATGLPSLWRPLLSEQRAR